MNNAQQQAGSSDATATHGKGKSIGVVDTTLRDAHQCLWATRMTTAHMLPVADMMDNIGFERIDLAGTIQFDVCVRYLKENPWERVRLMRDRLQKTPMSSFTRSKSIMSFDFIPDDIVELWVERLVANGFREIGTFDGLNDVDNMLVTINAARKLGVRAIGAVSYGLSPVHTDEVYVKTVTDLVKRGKVDAIWIKDAGGLLTVDRIRTLVPALKQVMGNIPLELHSHCMTGIAPLMYLEGIQAGADAVHTSIAPLANGNAQPSIQNIASNLRALGYKVDLDDALIGRVGEHFRRVAEQEGKPLGQVQEYDAFHYEHQLPGGMMANFRVQLQELGMSHKYQEVLEECARVRKELGYPILITPFAQFVGTQAVMNVLHGERYKIVPDEVKKYALGYYGKLLSPVDPAVMDKIVENGSQRIALKSEPLAPALHKLRAQHPNMSDDERVLRFMYAGNQVGEMLAAGPMKTTYEFEAPLVRLMRELAERRYSKIWLGGA
ncbi:pyruvate carboxylase subunit B [Lacisediminimonas sp.]|uniref:pyruvate carboxylase subunit B n=1 Tax=Lacisediminimonas sp. TaxID=3060582 RepID=UPI002728482F|nr:pyruvate carboxylase subunit B [Lacisediminimonas sp.]MDO8298719.1 pyruvate carboxylase subunit B [Lacisediminimonas sp.]MDO9216374.1 pyruvate carboxylase subunit B [Lacisediminimonas sp.]